MEKKEMLRLKMNCLICNKEIEIEKNTLDPEELEEEIKKKGWVWVTMDFRRPESEEYEYMRLDTIAGPLCPDCYKRIWMNFEWGGEEE